MQAPQGRGSGFSRCCRHQLPAAYGSRVYDCCHCLLAVDAAGCCLPHTLLQVVQLFDDILLLTDGHVVYQ